MAHLQTNTTYYWRVAGVNSEGQSRWSDVWHFTTGTNADVALTTSTNKGFSVVPNPAGAMVTISSTAGSSIESARVYDLLGRDVLHSRGGSTAELRLDVSSLSDGVYVLDLNNSVRTLLRVDHSIR
ncbi:MAG: T9SS type A sorting domain-containing protein [Bacteroidetes bacterium]|nr:T9SS type A sorting domain-containing protein [Bacteroidota bacterium]